MGRYFVLFFDRRTWRSLDLNKRLLGRTQLRHAGGDELDRKGIRRGDRVYVATWIGGSLFLGGRIRVGRMLARRAAARRFGENNITPGRWHVVAVSSGTEPFFPNLKVPAAIAGQLSWKSVRGARLLLQEVEEGVGAQPLRGMKELTRESATLLDTLYERALLEYDPELDEYPAGLY